MKQKNQFEVITKSRILIEYIFTVTEKSPKKFRFTIISRMHNIALDIMENLIRANEIYIKDKEQTADYRRRFYYQKEALIAIKLLGYISMIAREQECILPKQYEQIALQLSECRKMLGAWVLSDRKRLWG